MPEKGINEVSRSIRELYEKGMTAFQRQNLDYAITLFNQILQTEPGFYDCREALRATQIKKATSQGGFFKRMFGSASSSSSLAKGQLMTRNQPLEAIKVAEQILNSDPNNVSAHKFLAEAALLADLPRTAVLSLEIAFKNSPQDRDIALALGQALARTGQVERAEKILAELQRVHPQDQEISQALKNFSANRTLVEGGYEALSGGAGSYRDILKDKEEAVSLEQEQREMKGDDVTQRLLQEAAARLAAEPGNTKLLRRMAQLHMERREYDAALRYYQQITEREGGNDPSLDKEIAATKLRQFDQRLEKLDPTAPVFEKQKQELLREKREFQLRECQTRVERYPNDLAIRFELGQLYFEMGKLSEAIQEFQQAQKNPHIRIQALRGLGESFARRGMPDLAVRTFQNALKEKVVFDDEKKELIYLLGCTLEQMGKREEAVEQFKLIYEIDISYRDVAARIDAYYGSR